MSKLRVCVTFAVEEVYEYEGDDVFENEDEYIEQAKEQMLADFGLSEWQGDWYNTMVDYEEDEDEETGA